MNLSCGGSPAVAVRVQALEDLAWQVPQNSSVYT